jgi:hypothetical protein
MIATTSTPIIETFLSNYHANTVSIEYYFENETEGKDIVISLDIFSTWLCSNHNDLVNEYRYLDMEYSENQTNWFDMFNLIETFRKDIQNEFLNFYLNNF